MNKATLVSLAAAALTLAACNSDKKQEAAAPAAPVAPLTYEDSAMVSLVAKVEAIDYTSRRVTFRDNSGRATTFVAGPQVQRLNEIKVGDSVMASYTVSLQAELRPPTADEAANPILVTDTAGRSPQGSNPAGGVRSKVRILTTVQSVDVANKLVTLKGPMGDTTTVRGRKTENIQKIKVGDSIVVTYIESMDVALVKAN
ncbi:MAG: hypothetical protein ACKVS8_07385 [Phycisphaerales bacterium]